MDYEAARDSIQGHFNAYWVANSAAVNGGKVPVVEWDNLEKLDPKPVGAAWARCTVQHQLGVQRTLGETGTRRFGRAGLVTVQLFVPVAVGLTLADRLSKIAADAFEGKSTVDGVWFRNTSVREVGPDASWLQTNIVSAFEYDQVK